MTPSEYSLYKRFQPYNLKDIRARALSKYAAALDSSLADAPADKEWTEKDISIMLKDAMAVRS